MIVNIPFDSLLYTLFLRGYLRVKTMFQTFSLSADSSTKFEIPVSNKYEAIPYYLKIIPSRDDIFEIKFFSDKRLIIHDDYIKISIWYRGINFLDDLKIVLYTRDKFEFEIKNKSSDLGKITIHFTYGEVKEDIKEKVLDTYFLMINKEFEERFKQVKIERLELKRERKGRVC